MKLIGSNTSPYVRKARLVLLEKGITHDYVVDPPSDPNSEVYHVNPLGRIPALILDDGECIFDSVVIAEYADTLNDSPILIPRNDALARMRVRRWEALTDGIMDSAVVVRNEVTRPPATQLAATLTLHNNAITHTLQHIAAQLGTRDWCEGDALTLGDLALVSALAYLDLRQPERDWRGAHPNLAEWFGRMRARPGIQLSLADNK
ncbi:MAG: glutathione S-transferase N-terminal domain-containing protein [Gammaproteobacteria bacterium]|nr:glutathione S-transferase N-terminal domain-containing protein [Gammaproteobacteria bacterium]MBU1625352.1 glutathione S-transferase N-terminal domain-containing protein [Gammaproteobacteria bacterium]MBU1981612.1 glutathione S-transferase N-terminal domain-containing protein [Gammaproteobacteria bacterium]